MRQIKHERVVKQFYKYTKFTVPFSAQPAQGYSGKRRERIEGTYRRNNHSDEIGKQLLKAEEFLLL